MISNCSHPFDIKMEAQCGGGGAAAGGEMRKIHIIYFLSRKGRTEHPHLIKVHHLSKNGVHLRDVKRWLSELRGKDMPESFAWSYKRKYKTGYLWQDLLDEDLITPISDNEYVLKGSEIPSLNLYLRSPSKSRASFHEDEIQEHPKSTMEAPKNSSCEIEEESPKFGSEASTVTDDATKLEEEKNSGQNKPETPRKGDKIDNISSFWSSKNSSKNAKKNDASNNVPPNTPASSSTPRSSSEFTKSKSYSANVFRNLLTCGAMDTNETAMVTINRREKSSCYAPPKKPDDVENVAGYGNAARICRGDKLGGSERLFRTSWHQEQKPHPDARKSCDGAKSSSNSTKNEFSNLKPVSEAYKPINGPNCAQCGKTFKPEKLHKHMKSCRGLKSLAKGAHSASVLEARRSTVDSACQEPVLGYFLTSGSEFQ